MLVDHFLIPTLAARWFRRREFDADSGAGADEWHPASRVRRQQGMLARGYLGLLRFSLANRLLVLLWCGLAVFGAFRLYRHIGFVFFPESDRGQFEIRFELPLGYSIEQSLAASRVVTDPLLEIQKQGDLLHFVTALGSSEGLSSRLENDPASGPEFGSIMVQLKSPLDRTRHEDDIIREVREKILPWPGMKLSIDQVEEGPPGGSDVAVRLTGKDIEQLGGLSDRIVARLHEIPGTIDVMTDYRPDNPELVVEPKPDVVGLFGMTEAQVAVAVQTAIAGDNRIQITLDDEDIALRLQLAPEFQRHTSELQRLMLTSSSGRKAPIGELADLRMSSGLYSINRYNRNRAVMPRCNVVAPTRPDDVFAVLRREVLPELGFQAVRGNNMAFLGSSGSPADGVRATFTGENEERDKNFAYLVRSMVIGVILIFAILVLQFNSFRQAVLVLLTVPLSFIGVVLGMWVCGFPFSLASFIGLVSLTGVVVNDAIVVVDFINQARARGVPLRQAILESGINRLRAVLLTTLTTIGGLLPLMLNISGGAEFWQPLTGAIIFGLGFATLLTLIAIPVGYSLAYEVAGKTGQQA
jgi:HAE1 family hydrophobic/amphiphilic exporter-1